MDLLISPCLDNSIKDNFGILMRHLLIKANITQSEHDFEVRDTMYHTVLKSHLFVFSEIVAMA